MISNERRALISAFATLVAFEKNALGPAMQRMAARSAAECVWGLGLDELYGVKAREPEAGRTTIDQPRKIEGGR